MCSSVVESSFVEGLPQCCSWERTCLPVQEIQVPSWVRKDLLEKEMATHSSIPAWEIPCTEKPSGLQSMGSQESDT